jgi:uncharacterized membrane protein YoaK (UPF0700 family)
MASLTASALEGPLSLALIVLTVVTELVDAIVFTAKMTGNVVLLGFAVAVAPGPLVQRYVG